MLEKKCAYMAIMGRALFCWSPSNSHQEMIAMAAMPATADFRFPKFQNNRELEI